MSGGYIMHCIECSEGLFLYKPIAIHRDINSSVSYGFSDLGMDIDGKWAPYELGCLALQDFLMAHRGHELRVLSQKIDKFLDGVNFPNELIFIGEENSEIDNSIMPSPELELENYSSDLLEKIKRYNIEKL